MNVLSAEISSEIGCWLDEGDLPAFRLTNKLASKATNQIFARECFKPMITTVEEGSVSKSVIVATDPKFGPSVRHILYYLSGTESITTTLLAKSRAVLEALAAREQKAAIQVCVPVIAISTTANVETNLLHFVQHLLEFDHIRPSTEGSIALAYIDTGHMTTHILIALYSAGSWLKQRLGRAIYTTLLPSQVSSSTA